MVETELQLKDVRRENEEYEIKLKEKSKGIALLGIEILRL